MSLWDRIVEQSAETKAQYAFVSAVVVTGIIGMIWLSTIPSRFAQIPDTTSTSPAEESPEESLMDVFDATKDQVGAIAKSVDDIQQIVTEGLPAVVQAPDIQSTGELGTIHTAETATGTETLSLKDVMPNLVESATNTESQPRTASSTTQGAPRVIMIGTTTISQ